MSSTTMSTAQLPPPAHVLSLNDKLPRLTDSPRPPLPSDSSRTPDSDSPSHTPKPSSPALEKPARPPEQPQPDTEEEEEEDAKQKTDTDDIIDMETFQQILELDEDDDDREFSTGMVDAYFEQAISTFEDMDAALSDKDLKKLSSLGHFLKGSSAALGVSKVKLSCERIQHYGQCRDEELDKDLLEKEALDKIGSLLETVKEDYASAERWLKEWREGANP
ncbi:hypothetical protein AX15_000081 [Amanita polypyramis BW_CC]|nr:hypothetical protein AX15_000081 [Amanita polypyramis BW_CC]